MCSFFFFNFDLAGAATRQPPTLWCAPELTNFNESWYDYDVTGGYLNTLAVSYNQINNMVDSANFRVGSDTGGTDFQVVKHPG